MALVFTAAFTRLERSPGFTAFKAGGTSSPKITSSTSTTTDSSTSPAATARPRTFHPEATAAIAMAPAPIVVSATRPPPR